MNVRGKRKRKDFFLGGVEIDLEGFTKRGYLSVDKGGWKETIGRWKVNSEKVGQH